MVLAVTLLVLMFMVVPILVLLMIRSVGKEEAATEEALLSPSAHTVVWVVPEGEDPSLVRTHLAHAGFDSAFEHSEDLRLVIRCEPAEREKVREVIAGTEHLTYDGPVPFGLPLRFADEPV
jgi:hypothetical protein